MKTTIKTFTAAATAAFLISLQPAVGATTNVIVGFNGGLRFSPTNVLINTGDSVIWQWANTTEHSTTSGTNGVPGDDNGVPSGSWDSTLVSGVGHLFTNTFTSSGTFSYYCTLHHTEGMTGEVIVASASLLPPGIGFTNPLSGEVFAAPANVSIEAAVTNGSGDVTNVQFLVNSVVLANAATAPFSALAGNLAAGNYTLTAIALDNNDLSATNTIAISVVTPVTMVLSDFLKSGTGFQFSYPANIGLNYVVQRSTNLMTWTTLNTNTAASNPSIFLDANATNSFNFYRVGLLPNP
ncbi:MAG TPA: plastocyanin/azurin family copper-binding protein [Candidatus Sulfotelmatobacter sp.]|nr:plastocyanin/azurin family copper-binding protein [Candidatus Sulfotelmatobacter sp.]